MAYSFKTLQANIMKNMGKWYGYFLQAIYWGSVPAIVVYGLFSKPYSPIMLAVWGFLTGEEQQPESPYGMPPGMYQ